MNFTMNALLNSNNQIRTNRRYPNPIQTITQTAYSRCKSYVQTQTRINAMRMSGLNFDGYQINQMRKGLHSKSPECRNFFLQIPLENFIQLQFYQTLTIKSALESDSPACKNFFSQTPIETLVQCDAGTMFAIEDGLKSDSPEIRNLFLQTPLETLVQFDDFQMSETRIGLESNNPECRNFFSQTPIETLVQFDGLQIYNMIEAFIGNNPQLLNQINAEKDAARQNYFDNAPADAPRETLEANIDGLYAPMINHVINYTQRAIDTLDITPPEAYRKKIDSSRFNVLRNVQLASAAAKGANISMIANGVLAKIAEYRGGDPKDFIVDKSSLAAARAMYNRLFPNNDNH